jgi:hypothetical protein
VKSVSSAFQTIIKSAQSVRPLADQRGSAIQTIISVGVEGGPDYGITIRFLGGSKLPLYHYFFYFFSSTNTLGTRALTWVVTS